MNTLVDMISGMEVKEDDENYKNAVDYMFDGLAKRKPDCFAVKQYRKFKLSSGVISLKRLLNHYILKNWSSKVIKKSLEAYFFTQNTKLYFFKNILKHTNLLALQTCN